MPKGRWRITLEVEGEVELDPSEWSWPIVLEMADEPHLELLEASVKKIGDHMHWYKDGGPLTPYPKKVPR
jgi:hypothetical protein